MSVDKEFTLKILEIVEDSNPQIQLDDLIQKYLKKFELDGENDIEIIWSTNDSGIEHDYIKFFNSRVNLESFVKFYKDVTDVELKYVIIETLQDLNLQLPGHLFIKGISPKSTTEDLFNLFKPYGDIDLCKIIFNEFGASKGYGFINFSNRVEANKSIDNLNGKEIDGCQLFVNHHISKKDRLKELELKKKNFTNIYIKNLPSSIKRSQLMTTFGQFGEIESIILPKSKIQKDEVGNGEEEIGNESSSTGYGFINFKYHEDAKEALQKMNGFEIEQGMKLQIGKAEHKRDRYQYNSLNLHFNNNSNGNNNSLSPEPNSPYPLPHALPFGYNHMNNSQEMIFNDNKQHQYQHNGQVPLPGVPPMRLIPPPFFITPDSNIISTSTGLPIAGPQFQDSNLYICHLPKEFTDEDLKSLFSKFGQIISGKVITWQEGEKLEEGCKIGESKGFGFICFSSPLDASHALVNMNGYMLNSKRVLQVSFAQRKENKYLKGEMHHYIQNHLGNLYSYIGGIYPNGNQRLNKF